MRITPHELIQSPTEGLHVLTHSLRWSTSKKNDDGSTVSKTPATSLNESPPGWVNGSIHTGKHKFCRSAFKLLLWLLCLDTTTIIIFIQQQTNRKEEEKVIDEEIIRGSKRHDHHQQEYHESTTSSSKKSYETTKRRQIRRLSSSTSPVGVASFGPPHPTTLFLQKVLLFFSGKKEGGKILLSSSSLKYNNNNNNNNKFVAGHLASGIIANSLVPVLAILLTVQGMSTSSTSSSRRSCVFGFLKL